MFKLFVLGRVLDFAIAYIDKNWESLVAQGKEAVLNILKNLKAKFVGGDDTGVFGATPMAMEFRANLDAEYDRAVAEAPVEE